MAKLCWCIFLLVLVGQTCAAVGQATSKQADQVPAAAVPPRASQTQEGLGKDADARRAAALVKRQRADALDLCAQHGYKDAVPILEQLAAADPKDREVMSALGVSLVVTAAQDENAAKRKDKRARGRTYLAKAKELGVEDDLVEYYLNVIPEDGGSDTVFSDRKEVDEAMRRGEAAFAAKDYKGAIKAYTQAMMLDPNLYTAVLFIGDSYFADGQLGSAAEWFERAVKVDCNQETAYRYWGDALIRLHRMDEARSKFIDGIVADPYQARSWSGINQWAKAQDLRFNVPRIKSPNSVKLDGNKTNITIDPASLDRKDGSSAWMLYDLGKALWIRETFFKEFPNEKKYRHSLREESQLLRMVAESARQQLKSDKDLKLDSTLTALVQLDDSGLIEPYVLFFASDQGIAQDYAGYRAANRDKLRKYLDEFVVPKTAKE